MKYAVIADIHANLEALEVVLEDSLNQKCTHYCCVGDVVGYNALPKEGRNIIRGMGIPCIDSGFAVPLFCSLPVGRARLD
jgi:hypothetical protein